MCIEESFCPFTRDALNFQQPKIYAAPHHPAVSRFPLSLRRRSALSFCSVTTRAHQKSRVRSNNAPTRKVYVTFRAETNDYFDNRLVVQLFFRLIVLNTIILFTKKHNIPHSAQCPSNKLNAMKTYSA